LITNTKTPSDLGGFGFVYDPNDPSRKALDKITRTRPKITVTAAGRAVAGNACARLLADIAEVLG
jgi:hypothetical protein